VTTDKTIEVAVGRKIDILPSRKAQNVGKAQHGFFAAFGKIDRVGAPVHLSLLTRLRLESHGRFALWSGTHLPHFLPQDSNAAMISPRHKLFTHAHRGNVGILFEQPSHRLHKNIKLAGA
jgi:hypothetical protein